MYSIPITTRTLFQIQFTSRKYAVLRSRTAAIALGSVAVMALQELATKPSFMELSPISKTDSLILRVDRVSIITVEWLIAFTSGLYKFLRIALPSRCAFLFGCTLKALR